MGSNNIKQGARVESEHKSTYTAIKNSVKRTGRVPSFNTFTRHIARDHLKEDKNYYTKLKKARL